MLRKKLLRSIRKYLRIEAHKMLMESNFRSLKALKNHTETRSNKIISALPLKRARNSGRTQTNLLFRFVSEEIKNSAKSAACNKHKFIANAREDETVRKIFKLIEMR